MKLDRGWSVLSQNGRSPGATGGYFSVGYLVQHTSGKKAFLKAIDLSSAFSSPDPTRTLQILTEGYNFERDLLKECGDHGLDRVAIAIDDGNVRIPRGGPTDVVPYLIFDLADCDVRTQVDISKSFDLALRLRAMHHITTGLWQLHKHSIAHQDLKPSNVLVYGGKESKITDLGRAASQGRNPPHEDCHVAGDQTYAPPELLYKHLSPDWHTRRQGCDAYLLGSMVVFLFAGSAMTPELFKGIPPTHHYKVWTGTYLDVLPIVQNAFGHAITKIKEQFDEDLRADLTEIVLQLCDPDVSRRGHPKMLGTKTVQFSLERYVAKFDLLARRAEVHMLRRAKP